jgi:hypothetical protein
MYGEFVLPRDYMYMYLLEKQDCRRGRTWEKPAQRTRHHVPRTSSPAHTNPPHIPHIPHSHTIDRKNFKNWQIYSEPRPIYLKKLDLSWIFRGKLQFFAKPDQLWGLISRNFQNEPNKFVKILSYPKHSEIAQNKTPSFFTPKPLSSGFYFWLLTNLFLTALLIQGYLLTFHVQRV